MVRNGEGFEKGPSYGRDSLPIRWKKKFPDRRVKKVFENSSREKVFQKKDSVILVIFHY